MYAIQLADLRRTVAQARLIIWDGKVIAHGRLHGTDGDAAESLSSYTAERGPLIRYVGRTLLPL